MSRVIVVGAGVVGLTCAVRLLEAGHRVDVVARDLPRETTSSVAAALWYPYLAMPYDRVLGWSSTSYDMFARLANVASASGVAMRPGVEVLRELTERPWWEGAVPELKDTYVVPDGFQQGWTFVAPVIEMPVYLDWLATLVRERGGTITRMNLSALPTGGADVVVNCSGIASKFLAADDTLHPVQGQVVIVEQVGLEKWWLDGSGPTYVVPRSRDIVIGGTDVDGEWSRTPSSEVASGILRRALKLVPELAGAEVLAHRVGLRPARPTVRLERVDDVIHCYGHGGAGVTLSWGCAEEVLSLVG